MARTQKVVFLYGTAISNRKTVYRSVCAVSHPADPSVIGMGGEDTKVVVSVQIP